MLDPSHDIFKLLARDRRYKFEAYRFVFEALRYAHETLGMGMVRAPQEEEPAERVTSTEPGATPERHLTGQQLCEAIRQYALQQYGYMAKCVFNSWGIHQTGDFGEIVFNLIEIGEMRKTTEDRREDFNDVFDFDADLQQRFEITRPES